MRALEAVAADMFHVLHPDDRKDYAPVLADLGVDLEDEDASCGAMERYRRLRRALRRAEEAAGRYSRQLGAANAREQRCKQRMRELEDENRALVELVARHRAEAEDWRAEAARWREEFEKAVQELKGLR